MSNPVDLFQKFSIKYPNIYQDYRGNAVKIITAAIKEQSKRNQYSSKMTTFGNVIGDYIPYAAENKDPDLNEHIRGRASELFYGYMNQWRDYKDSLPCIITTVRCNKKNKKLPSYYTFDIDVVENNSLSNFIEPVEQEVTTVESSEQKNIVQFNLKELHVHINGDSVKSMKFQLIENGVIVCPL